MRPRIDIVAEAIVKAVEQELNRRSGMSWRDDLDIDAQVLAELRKRLAEIVALELEAHGCA